MWARASHRHQATPCMDMGGACFPAAYGTVELLLREVTHQPQAYDLLQAKAPCFESM